VTIHGCPTPTLASAVAASSTTVTLTFTRRINPASVNVNGSQFTFDNGLTASAAVVNGRQVTLTTSAQTGGTTYTVTVPNTVTDTLMAPIGTPNTATFVGFQQLAQVRINELNANVNSGCDLIELRVVSGGSMLGFRLTERITTLVTFGNLNVATNDIIVVHMGSGVAACNPGTATDELTAINQRPQATFGANYDTAWDIWSTDTGLTSTDNTITLYNPSSVIVDVVLIAQAATGTASVDSETPAAAAAAANQWQMVGGGVPAGGFVDDNFRGHAVLDSDATGTAVTGESLRRVDNTDDNDKADWLQGASTFGLINAGQTAF
jgi:hypothetical protein